jgi:hypothetical protein
MADDEGNVRGVWLQYLGSKTTHYRLGINSSAMSHILENIDLISSPDPPSLSGFPLEVVEMSLVDAREIGLSPDWVSQITKARPTRPKVFKIHKIENSSHAVKSTKGGP